MKMTYRKANLLFLGLSFFLLSKQAFTINMNNEPSLAKLHHFTWYSGSRSCEKSNNPALEVFQYDSDSYILRQNKCLHYEAPFIYLFFGENKAFILDTGAIEDARIMPLASTILTIISNRRSIHTDLKQDLTLIIAHSHSHGDHIAGDSQLKQLDGHKFAEGSVIKIHYIEPNNPQALYAAFNIKEWPTRISELDLGKRMLKILPSPGHHEEGISIYDPQTNWLLTGDTFYPGRLYINAWAEFKATIKRLNEFVKQNDVKAILGAHIEMSSRLKSDYPVGSKYHEDEASLVLFPKDLQVLDNALDTLGDTPTYQRLNKFIIYPVN